MMTPKAPRPAALQCAVCGEPIRLTATAVDPRANPTGYVHATPQVIQPPHLAVPA